MAAAPDRPAVIYHLAPRAAWEAAAQTGEYRSDTLATEGFIHCSTAAQVGPVAERFFAGRDDLVLLHIRADRLTAELRYESPDRSPHGEHFPHIYGPLNLDAVQQVTKFRRLAAGGWPLAAGC